MRVLPPLSYYPTLKGLITNIIRREPVFPFYASFKLTSRCHFGCPFCNVRKNPVPDLPTEDVKAILRNLSRSSVLMTSFEGGEPLLRPDIGELLAYARQCGFYLLFTTSVRNLSDYPIAEYSKYIDFLHVSIDEGHGNTELFDELPGLVARCAGRCQLSVQSVVTSDTIDLLNDKVAACREAGVNIVVIPAARMDNADDAFPDMAALERKLRELRILFPDTIHTPMGYFDAYRKRQCSPATVIIAPDGRLYYPCHILNRKGPDLRYTDLTAWLESRPARFARADMSGCRRNCGWYQYYAINSYTSISSVWETLRPVLIRKKRPLAPAGGL
ncbi:MAG: radical SAM protein [Chitinispirillaceae bacterium]|jgi:MoaA/NifB/PqqE/SkfB family radical SAM enzyme|nr:radical SAM protein [Chitinispirillaceae bacterium]